MHETPGIGSLHLNHVESFVRFDVKKVESKTDQNSLGNYQERVGVVVVVETVQNALSRNSPETSLDERLEAAETEEIACG